jgi:hypothetical protein
VKTNKKTSPPPPIIDHSIGHVGRRLLNEPSHNTDDGEFESFMKVNDDELSKQLFNMDLAMDGSGESMFREKNALLIKNKIFSFYSDFYNTTNNK